jgi:predicted pyridoxine 5'-phosphate oxidase superfamily flavin-nucleotide-binding protein
MGTQAKNGGVDTSHRGGMKGFLEFINEDTISIPDYSGNNMFLSLGNIIENPNAGLLFIGFETGATLQLSGKAYIELDENDFERGIERYWYFKIEKNIFTQNVLPMNWGMPHYSPFNPALQ